MAQSPPRHRSEAASLLPSPPPALASRVASAAQSRPRRRSYRALGPLGPSTTHRVRLGQPQREVRIKRGRDQTRSEEHVVVVGLPNALPNAFGRACSLSVLHRFGCGVNRTVRARRLASRIKYGERVVRRLVRGDDHRHSYGFRCLRPPGRRHATAVFRGLRYGTLSTVTHDGFDRRAHRGG